MGRTRQSAKLLFRSSLLVAFAITAGGCLSSGETRALTDSLLQPLPEPSPDSAGICKAGDVVDCSSLGALWKSGLKATCAPGGRAYDVSACVRVNNTKAANYDETVYPAQRNARWANAKCNHSGDFVFTISMPPVPSGIWVITLEGGGACALDSSLPNGCGSREDFHIMPVANDGTPFPKDGTVAKGAIQTDADFAGAIYVKANYCTSDLWTGTNTTGVPMTWRGSTSNWTFTGHLNVEAMLDVLSERYGLNDADPRTSILLRGVSAGGWGVMNNVSTLKTRFPRAAAGGRLMASSWAGFQADQWDNPNFPIWGYREPNGDALSFQRALDMMASTWKSSLYAPCVRDNPAAPSSCLTGEALYEYITGPESASGLDIPLLVFQNVQDQLYMSGASIPPITNKITSLEMDARNEFITQMRQTLGLTGMPAHASSRIKWLYAVSDPVKTKVGGGLEPNVHPPICYINSSPDGTSHSLDRMFHDFWNTRGQGPGRGVAAGQVRTYDVNYVTSPTCP